MNMQRMFNAGAAVVAAVAATALTAGAASANLVANGDFSANASSYVTYPGYSSGPSTSGTNPFNPTDWTVIQYLQPAVGVNGPDTGFYGKSLTNGGSPFAPSSTSIASSTSQVRDFAFMQDGINTAGTYNNSTVEQVISTIAGHIYKLSYVAAQWSGDSGATLETLVTDAVNNTQIASQIPSITTSAFNPFSLTFTATSASTEIAFINNTNTSVSNTVDVSNVVMVDPPAAVPLPASIGLLGLGTVGLGLLLLKRRAGRTAPRGL